MEGTANFASVAAPIVSDGLSFYKNEKGSLHAAAILFMCLREHCCDIFLDLGIVNGKQRHKDDSQNREDAGEE